MALINKHHIDYDYPDWTVELNGQMHRTIMTIQHSKATPERYAIVTNFVHSLVHEWNRMRRELDLKEHIR